MGQVKLFQVKVKRHGSLFALQETEEVSSLYLNVLLSLDILGILPCYKFQNFCLPSKYFYMYVLRISCKRYAGNRDDALELGEHLLVDLKFLYFIIFKSWLDIH